MLVNYHVHPTENNGDKHSSPLDYFPLGQPVAKASIYPLKNLKLPPNPKAIIIGGGGLIAPFAIRPMELILSTYAGKCLIVGWGIGQNYHFSPQKHHSPLEILNSLAPMLSKFDLLGLRDDTDLFEWVPCASCMHPLISIPIEPTEEYVVYEHKKRPISIPGIPKLNNFDFKLEDAIKFLASAECVITNSYHGVYWATLLNRKVVCLPFSSRFTAMRFPPAFASDLGEWKTMARQANKYDEARSICVHQNVKFYNQVMDRLY